MANGFLRVLAIVVTLSVVAEPSLAQTTIPADVTAAARAKGTLCPATSVAKYAMVEAPSRIAGYNSRMDNTERVPGATLLNRFVADMSSAAAFAATTGDPRTKDQILSALSSWARQGALMGTVSCTSGGRLTDKCSEWRKPDGSDLSDAKDFSSVQMSVASLRRVYLTAVADHATDTRADEHVAVQAWFSFFQKRMKTPDKLYFGLQMGWHWPAIDAALLDGNEGKAKSTATRMVRSLEKLFAADGSIKDRTTRGDRALWYHNSALNEAVISLGFLRAVGGSPSKALEEKLHAAVNLFVRSVQDHSVIDPWAKEALNARYTPGYQDWRSDWWNNSWGGSWWHIYAYRYPDRAEAKWLAAKVSPRAASASQDEEAGVALGCIYRSARGG
jgi:hypothetical protein